MTVRNACVARGMVTPTTSTPVYTVPANHVLLLKQASMRPVDQVDWQTALTVVSADGLYSSLVFETPLGPMQTQFWEGWIACNGGDEIFVSAWQTDLHYWISGALLPYQLAPPSGAMSSETNQ